MKIIVELGKFPDGRFMTKVRFIRGSNFWIHNLDEASWVPTLEEADFVKEALDLVNEGNEIKKTLRRTGRTELPDSSS